MAKRPTVPDQPDRDPDQMITDVTMTSVFTGIAFVLSVLVYSLFAAVALNVAGDSGRTMKMIIVAAGLATGAAIVVLLLRTYSVQLKARSLNLHRGAWIGAVGGLVIIVLLYYLPELAFPRYCPPGAVCG